MVSGYLRLTWASLVFSPPLGMAGRAAPEAEAVKAAPTKTEAKDDLSRTILKGVGRLKCSKGSRGPVRLF